VLIPARTQTLGAPTRKTGAKSAEKRPKLTAAGDIRSGCDPAAIRLRSGCDPAAIRLQSGCDPAALSIIQR
jgi:hypothetical protein